MDVLRPFLDRLDGVPISIQVIAGVLVLGIVYSVLTGERAVAGLPIITLPREGWEKWLPNKFSWILHGNEILAKGLRECATAFQVETGSGYKVVVPNRFADELKNHSHLNFNEAFAKDLFINYPGFDGFRQGLQDDTLMQEIVRVKLTQSLGLVTEDLVDETTESLHDLFGENFEWQDVPAKQHILQIVARLSSRVFLGLPLCRDSAWLDISKGYTVDTFMSANLLRLVPDLLRPLAFWAIPSCRRIVGQVRLARKLITPEVERRRRKAEECLARGEKPPKQSDTIGWMVEVARGRKIDYVAAQLALTTAAIHTTSETASKCIMQLCDTPEIIQPLREEMIKVLREDGWNKTSLYKMRLLDSFLKEVQRLDGLSNTTLNRLVKKPVTLSDGTTIPAGVRIMVADDCIRKSEFYSEPDTFDAARFLKMRQRPGEENRHQFVTTTVDMMAFGHGQHACPGRFFASNEIKIMLTFLLLKYDLRFAPGQTRPKNFEFETTSTVNPNFSIQIKRRREEVDLLRPQMAN